METHPGTPDSDRIHARPKRRRIKIVPTEREHWRRVFLGEMFARPRICYRVEQDLRPLWKAVDHEVESGTIWHQLVPTVDAASEGELVDPSRQAYLALRNEIIVETMRTRHQGKPPPWVEDYLDQAVQGKLSDAPLFPASAVEIPPDKPRLSVKDRIPFSLDGEPEPLYEITLRVQAGPFGAVLRAENGMITTSGKLPVPKIDVEFPDPTGRWDDWKQLEVAARRALDQLLFEMRRAYEDRYPEQINVSADEDRRQYARDLVTYLLDGKSLGRDPAKRLRLHRFAKGLGLDFPVS